MATETATHVADDKPFEKLTAKELRALLQEYAEARGFQWPPVDENEEPLELTAADVRELLAVQLPAYLSIIRDGPFIDGQHWTESRLSFNEQTAVRDLCREASGNDEDPGSLAEGTDPRVYWPAFVTVVKRRNDPSFSFEQAGELTYEDLVKPKDAASDGAAGRGREVGAEGAD